MRRTFFVLALAALSSLAGAARASVQIAVLFDDLVRGSSAVCVFVGLEQKAAWEDGRIYTRTRVRCDRPLGGDLKQGQEAWIRTLGGIVGDVGQSVSGEAAFAAGAASIAFVHAGPAGALEVTARAQGHFPVRPASAAEPARAARGPDVGGIVAARPGAEARVASLARAPLTPSATLPALAVVPGKTIDEVAKEVAAAWPRTHT